MPGCLDPGSTVRASLGPDEVWMKEWKERGRGDNTVFTTLFITILSNSPSLFPFAATCFMASAGSSVFRRAMKFLGSAFGAAEGGAAGGGAAEGGAAEGGDVGRGSAGEVEALGGS